MSEDRKVVWSGTLHNGGELHELYRVVLGKHGIVVEIKYNDAMGNVSWGRVLSPELVELACEKTIKLLTSRVSESESFLDR